MIAIREDNLQTFISARDIYNKRISIIIEFLNIIISIYRPAEPYWDYVGHYYKLGKTP
jgi:hypothetical protein